MHFNVTVHLRFRLEMSRASRICPAPSPVILSKRITLLIYNHPTHNVGQTRVFIARHLEELVAAAAGYRVHDVDRRCCGSEKTDNLYAVDATRYIKPPTE